MSLHHVDVKGLSPTPSVVKRDHVGDRVELLVDDVRALPGCLKLILWYEDQHPHLLTHVVLQRLYPDVKKAVGSSEKVFEYMDRTPQLPPPGNLKPAHLKGHVQFKNVTFSYPKRKDTPALQDVSFDLREGQVTALVGACDAGKSTVVQLLLKFYQPQQGQILLDGKPVSEYDNEYYRRMVSVVSQEPVLTARPLDDNISYGLGHISQSSVENAAAAANAHDFISSMVDGYKTGAGQKGALLSGGQKQRVALARALVRDPKVLILDDVSSSLDSESELKIQSTIYDNPTKRTVLLISHRLNFVEKADHILVLEGGQIRESGRHEHLLAQEGVYWRLGTNSTALSTGRTETPRNEKEATLLSVPGALLPALAVSAEQPESTAVTSLLCFPAAVLTASAEKQSAGDRQLKMCLLSVKENYIQRLYLSIANPTLSREVDSMLFVQQVTDIVLPDFHPSVLLHVVH
ncbi:unnamed protein product [Ranitomeya imitator]|uniref:ABC transporter domain-containing protein n=1 Tax=Ranitomeya imitator TaxID=111125 RepID=A0ABN9LPS6_9NEOB|nr:unnamed protein product [Ranitomeya imitator]